MQDLDKQKERLPTYAVQWGMYVTSPAVQIDKSIDRGVCIDWPNGIWSGQTGRQILYGDKLR